MKNLIKAAAMEVASQASNQTDCNYANNYYGDQVCQGCCLTARR